MEYSGRQVLSHDIHYVLFRVDIVILQHRHGFISNTVAYCIFGQHWIALRNFTVAEQFSKSKAVQEIYR